MRRKEVEKQDKALKHKSKEIEHKSKELQLKHHDLLENKTVGASVSATAAAAAAAAGKTDRMRGELQCCICQDLMAMTHSLRCGHTFCGICILKVALSPKP